MVFDRAVPSLYGNEGHSRATDPREVFNTIQLMLDAGCRQRAIILCFPPSATIQKYFYSWRCDGAFDRIMDPVRASDVFALMQMYFSGVLTRKIAKMTEALCDHGFSASTISWINAKLNAWSRKARDLLLVEPEAIVAQLKLDWPSLRANLIT